MKAGAEMRERIGRVEARHIGGKQRFGHGKSLNIARTGLSSAPTMRNGRATSWYRPGGTSTRTSTCNIRMSAAYQAWCGSRDLDSEGSREVEWVRSRSPGAARAE